MYVYDVSTYSGVCPEIINVREEMLKESLNELCWGCTKDTNKGLYRSDKPSTIVFNS